MAAIRSQRDLVRVLVLPITHTEPQDETVAIEIPTPVKARLKLDSDWWIIVSEWNEFVWPGPDLRQRSGGDELSFAYGMLPPKLFASVRERLLHLVARRTEKRVTRS